MLNKYDLPITGIALIDEQHRQYLALTERVLGLYNWSAATSAKMMKVLEELTVFVLEHFDAEEHLMQATAYPAYDEHVRKHDMFRSWLDRIQARFQNGSAGTDDIESIPKWLVVWFRNQVQTDDMRLADYLKNRNKDENHG